MALSSTDNNTGSDSPAEICPMCCETILEATEDTEGQEALFCEGTCQKLLHRSLVPTPGCGHEISYIVGVLEYTMRATQP